MPKPKREPKRRDRGRREVELSRGVGMMSDRLTEDEKLKAFMNIFHPGRKEKR